MNELIAKALMCDWRCSMPKCFNCPYVEIEEGGLGICNAKHRVYKDVADALEKAEDEISLLNAEILDQQEEHNNIVADVTDRAEAAEEAMKGENHV